MKPFAKLLKPANQQTNQNATIKGNLNSNLQENIKFIQQTIGNSSDIIIRQFQIGKEKNIRLAVIYTEGLSDKNLIQEFILKTLMIDLKTINIKADLSCKDNVFNIFKDSILPDGELYDSSDFDCIFTHLLSGDAIILMDEYTKGYIVSSKSWKDRGVQEASSQTVVRGPKDSFTETLRTNTALLRRRIKDTNLWIETTQIGKRTKTDVAIAYIKDIANDKIVQQVRDRLSNIDIDGILESWNIEELIQDNSFSPFPTLYNTERPDVAAAGLLEGRVALIVDGTPFVLLAPALFIHFMQSPEDYYQSFYVSSFMRSLRLISFFLTLLTPSIYIAITTFHQEMLPPTLLFSIASQREGVPFPAFFEALIMEIAFEILREAGIRMPRAIGPAISIVGALILGEAAVQAGIVSSVMVIVVSTTAISSFVFPAYNITMSIRNLRFVFMILGATFGLYGISLGLIALLLHMCSLRSFGIPYMSPLAPFILEDQKDTLLRFPLWAMFKRPRLISQKNSIRQQSPSDAKPKPPKQ